MDILDGARGQVLEARASVAAFEKYTIDSTQRVLGTMHEQISSAVSMIRDVDVAQATSELVRSEILVKAGVSSMMHVNQRRALIGDLLSGA